MKFSCVLLVLAALIVPNPLAAQSLFGDGLPPEVQNAIDSSIRKLENQGLMSTRASVAEIFGEEQLQHFMETAVVRLELSPEGQYDAYTQSGGKLVSFRLGKSKIQTSAPAEDAGWLKASGSFELPKRAQKLSLQMKAGPREVEIDCANRYRKSDETVTFYVGVLDGLFCLGFTDGELGAQAAG